MDNFTKTMLFELHQDNTGDELREIIAKNGDELREIIAKNEKLFIDLGIGKLEADIKTAIEIIKKRMDESDEQMKDSDEVNFKDKIVSIDEESYGRFIGEIARLKPKKRKNWSSVLINKCGTRSRIRYEDGKFWNWCSDVQKWCEAITHDRLVARQEKEEGSGEYIPGTYVGWVKCVGFELNKMGYSKDATEVMVKAGFERSLAENLTGNHYRNQTVTVGQDVYG
jgi:hypothetical protein